MKIPVPTPGLRAAGFVLAFLVQGGLVGAMIADRASILAGGREVRLPVVPVDPRDLFRGDYVVLSYPISRLELATLAHADETERGDTVYVSLVPDGAGWRATGLHAKRPKDGLVLQAQVTFRAKPTTGPCPKPCGAVTLAYGLEKFFVPEGKGRAIEDQRNAQKVEVDAAVAADGRAVLKRLIVDGAVRFEDALL